MLEISMEISKEVVVKTRHFDLTRQNIREDLAKGRETSAHIVNLGIWDNISYHIMC